MPCPDLPQLPLPDLPASLLRNRRQVLQQKCLPVIVTVAMLWIASSSKGVFVQALCTLESDKGEQIPLHRLPAGVEYMADTDTLRCNTPRSCKGWSIRNCIAVYCHGYQSCMNCQMVDNSAVACWATEACQQAQLLQSIVSCGDGYTGECGDGVLIQTDAQVLCYGPDACMRHSEVNVGATGFIRCADGNGRAACHDMTVYLKGGRRACFGKDNDGSSCAVTCATERDCDRGSIRFIVRQQ